MAIEKSPYLPKQMNGPVVNSVMSAMEEQLENTKFIENYLYTLKISTAQETELENIGRIIGYPRPLVPEGLNQENLLIFTHLPQEIDETIGFGTIGEETGGRFSTVEPGESNYMALGLYRKFLEKVAYIKRYGITIYAVDNIARLIARNYTISWNETTQDIEIHFQNAIGYQNVWILSELFYRLATAPQVIIYDGE